MSYSSTPAAFGKQKEKPRSMVDKPTKCAGCGHMRPPKYFTRATHKCDDCLPRIHTKPQSERAPIEFLPPTKREEEYKNRRDKKLSRRMMVLERAFEVEGNVMSEPKPAVQPPDKFLAPKCGEYVERSPDPVVPLESICTFVHPKAHAPQAWLPWTKFAKRSSRPNHLQYVCLDCNTLEKQLKRKKDVGEDMSGIAAVEAPVEPAQVIDLDVPGVTIVQGSPDTLPVVDPVTMDALVVVAMETDVPLTPIEMAEELLAYVQRTSGVSEEVAHLRKQMSELEARANGLAEDIQVANELIAQYKQDADALRDNQKAYQRRLVQAGMTIPPKYALLNEQEMADARSDS